MNKRKKKPNKNSNLPSFTISISKIQDRLDPSYYIESKYSPKNIAEAYGYELTKLGMLIKRGPKIGKHEKEVEEGEYINAITSSALKPFYIDLGRTIKVSSKSPGPVIDRKPELLINLRGASAGDACLGYDEIFKMRFAQGVASIILDTEIISPVFLEGYLNSLIGKYEINRFVPSTRNNLSINSLLTIDVVIPPKDIQEKIANKIIKAKNDTRKERDKVIRKQKELDNYPLMALNIELKSQNEGITSTVINSDMLLSDIRMDVPYFLDMYSDILEGYDNYPIYKLGELCDISTGVTPSKQSFSKKGIPFVRVGEMSTGHITLENCKKVIMGSKKKAIAQSGDVLISITGTIGSAAVIPIDTEVVASSALAILKPKSDIDPNYLAFFITTIGADQINRYSTGTTISHLRVSTLKNIHIIVPPLQTQKKIAKKYNSFKEEINNRKENGKDIIRKAMEEYVDMLVGGAT